MKAIVLSKTLDQDYEDEDGSNNIAAVNFDYSVGDGLDRATVSILMSKKKAEEYKLGEEVNLLE